MSKTTISKALLRDLLLSLLNATLLLAVVLVLAATVLVYKVESFTDEIIDDVQVAIVREARDDVRVALRSIDEGVHALKNLSTQVAAMKKKPVELLTPKDHRMLEGLEKELQRSNELTVRFLRVADGLSDKMVVRIAEGAANAFVRTMQTCKASIDG